MYTVHFCNSLDSPAYNNNSQFITKILIYHGSKNTDIKICSWFYVWSVCAPSNCILNAILAAERWNIEESEIPKFG
jgi:hypothetical protein